MGLPFGMVGLGAPAGSSCPRRIERVDYVVCMSSRCRQQTLNTAISTNIVARQARYALPSPDE
jgi:hypothetical protein